MERTNLAQAADTDAGARRRLSLDGVWQFRHEDGPWREAHVPGPWQAEFSDLVDTSGRAVYRRSFALPEGWNSQELALQFGAVSYFCEVLLNGQKIGSHEGAFLPFEIVVPTASLKSHNELEVRVTMPSADHRAYPDFPFGEVPHGKISWYGRIGGLWQSVALEARDPRHVEDVAITAGMDGKASVELSFSAAANGTPVELSILDSDGSIVAQTSVTAGQGVSASLVVAGAKLWSTDTPNLYSLVVDMGTDKVTTTFGFRTVEARAGQILLNGKPIYMRGALDQDYYPDGIYTPPSLEGTIVYPGNFGVFNWGSVAVDPERQIMFGMPTYLAFTSRLVPRSEIPPKGEGEKGSEQGLNRNEGAPYGVYMGPFLSALGIPCQAPPWGYVAGVDLKTGKIAYQHKNGTVYDMTPLPLPIKLGVPGIGGPLLTGGGVAFLGAAVDDFLRAYDVTTGKEIWRARLPAGGQSTPMTYTTDDGKQYVVMVAGGHGSIGTKPGDYVIAYTLPTEAGEGKTAP